MITTASKRFLEVKVIDKKPWMIYEIYNEFGDVIFLMGQPVGNSKCYRFGKTIEELSQNIINFATSTVIKKKIEEKTK